MRFNRFLPLAFIFIICLPACHGTGTSGAGISDTVSFPNISAFLKGQFRKIDSLGIPLTITETHNGKLDSGGISSAGARQLVAPFLGENQDPDLQSGTGQYTRSVFPDSSHHRSIVSYEAEGDSVALNRVDVFLDSGSREMQQLYLQYTTRGPDSSIRLQLIWKTNQEFTLIRTVDKRQYTADLRKQKVVWGIRP